MNPVAKVVAGYQPIMPTYQGQLSEDQIVQLVPISSLLVNPLVQHMHKRNRPWEERAEPWQQSKFARPLRLQK
jgi:cytochrome c oxidase subunit 2